MGKRIGSIVLVAVVMNLALWARGAEFYVSPNGNDSNRGSAAAPFRTMVRAQAAVRALRPSMNADIVVHVGDGTYRLERPLSFGPEDGGANGHRVIYEAKAGETPVLTSLQPVKGWKLHDEAKKIYVANVNFDFRQFYLDGKMATRARYPNVTSPNDLGPYLRLTGADEKTKRYGVATSDWNKLPDIANKRAMELVVHLHWIHHHARFDSAQTEGKVTWIAPQEPERGPAFYKPGWFYKGCVYFFENAYELIDVPGEWYYDRAARKLYCQFDTPPGDTLRTEVPTLESLLTIAGSAKTPVQDLEFRGLTFEGSTWTNPSQRGAIFTQLAQPVLAKRTPEKSEYPPGMVRAIHARRLAFRNNTFRHAGATGLQLWAHVCDSDIEGNTFYNCAANALEIDAHGAANPPADKQSVNVAIWNNKFEHAGSVYSNGGAILAHFVKNLIVDHNEITDMPYSGMQIGNQPGGYKDCGCTGNLIRYNHVSYAMRQHDDGGAIYTLGGQQTGSVIFENYIHHVIRSPWAGNWPAAAVYLDNNTQFIKVTRNVIEHCTGGAGQMNHAKDNVLKDNPPADAAACKAIIKNAGIKPGYSPRAKQ